MHRSRAIFINVEPDAIMHERPLWLGALIEAARERLTVVLEITERALTQTPAALLCATAGMRRWGAAVALDDVGDSGPDHLRRFDFVLTHDRERVIATASALMVRLAAAQTSPELSTDAKNWPFERSLQAAVQAQA